MSGAGGSGGAGQSAQNTGLIVAGFIAVCVVIGLAWQCMGPSAEAGGSDAQEGAAVVQPSADASSERASESTPDYGGTEEAAERFALAAYGYGGTDAAEYRRGVTNLVTPDFWSSPGGADVEGGMEMVADGGVAGEAETYLTTDVRGFEVSEQGEEGVSGVVYTTQEVYPLREMVYAERELTLVPRNGGWAVSYAGEWVESSDSPMAAGVVELAPYRGEELPKEDREAMADAAERYVKAVHAYQGSDVGEYRAGVREAVAGPEFFESPGGERVAEQIGFVKEQTQSAFAEDVPALYLEGFLPREKLPGGEVEGVFFSNEEGFEGSPWAELVRLREESGTWKISYAGGVIDGISAEQEAAVDEMLNEQESEDLFEEERELGGETTASAVPEGTAAEATAAEASFSESEDEVAGAAEDYYRAVDERDWSYTYAHLDAETRASFGEEEWRRKNEYHAIDAGLTSLEVVVGGPSGGPAVPVTVNRTFEDGTEISRETLFVREEGAWRHRFTEEENGFYMPGTPYDEFVEAQDG